MSRNTLIQQSQNVGNKISSTPSVKLHAPPGGASSFSLSWGAEPAAPVGRGGRRAAPQAAPAAPAPAPAYGAYDAYAPAAAAPAAVVEAHAPPTGAGGGLSSNAFATGSNQNCGNFITERRTTKVAAPPGGRSSIVLG